MDEKLPPPSPEEQEQRLEEDRVTRRTFLMNVGIGLNAVLPKGRSGFLLWEHLTGYAGAHENRYSVGVRIEF